MITYQFLEFSFYSPRGAEACEKVTVSSINHKKELEQFHQHRTFYDLTEQSHY